MDRNEKKARVRLLQEKFARAQSVVLLDFSGTSVPQITALRAKLREQDVEYRVVKNTLALRALEDTPLAALQDHFSGPTAMALSYDDPVVPARALQEATKELKTLQFKAILLEGRVLGPEAVAAVAKLPSKNELRANLLSVLQGPQRNFLGVLQAPLRNFVGLLEALRRECEAEDATSA
jgi:large subunit ribosomal protein L10